SRIGRPAEHRIIHGLLRADIADDGITGKDANAKAERCQARLFLLQLAKCALHRDGGLYRARGVVRVMHRSTEESLHGLAYVLVESTAMLEDNWHQFLVD